VGPIVLFCLYPRSVRVWFEAGPDGLGAHTSQAAKDVIAVLTQMGFRPVGVKVEKARFRPAIRELSFVAKDGRCYGSAPSPGQGKTKAPGLGGSKADFGGASTAPAAFDRYENGGLGRDEGLLLVRCQLDHAPFLVRVRQGREDLPSP
jgi:hypothetical protein